MPLPDDPDEREEWLSHPSRELARRLDALAATFDLSTDTVLQVVAQWLEDVELSHSPVVRTPDDPHWHPRALATSFARVQIRDEIRRREAGT